jgi:DNA-binding NtrC family response regulator
MQDRADLPKLLIVDDERLIADTLATIFNASGYEARPAYSAEQALEVIAGWDPIIAIIDVIMPAMNGIDLGILLRAMRPSIQVMLISGQMVTGLPAGEARKKEHPFQTLAKPIPVYELLEMTAKLLPNRLN